MWIIGTGSIAIEYSKILKKLERDFVVIGRGESSAQKFFEDVGVKPVVGGLQNYLLSSPLIPNDAIVAVNVEQLYKVTKSLIEAGVKRIFLEKPGAATYKEAVELNDLTKANNTKVYIAYNRRFYESVIKAREIIKEDGGVKSFLFEFTEWSHVIAKLQKPQVVFDNWLYANSTHVIDLAFNICGKPKRMSCFSSGEGVVTWHKDASVFHGAGEAENGALFSYYANWSSAGRWGIEIQTSKRKLILKPLEGLKEQLVGTIKEEEITLNKANDEFFKPGFLNQTKAFINSDDTYMCDIEEQVLAWEYYEKIRNGGNWDSL